MSEGRSMTNEERERGDQLVVVKYERGGGL